MWYPKYFHATVPHSGTRYINGAFQAEGIKIAQRHSHVDKEQWTDMVFCHIGPNWVPYLEDCIEHSDKAWMTIRSPIGTWGTQWANTHATFQTSEFLWKEKLGQLRGQWETQMQLAPSFDYIHRVEKDPIAKLGRFTGLHLGEDNNTFSTQTKMKFAIRERDTKRIAELCEGTEFWTCFVESITPDIADFYEDLGYDIWWKNG